MKHLRLDLLDCPLYMCMFGQYSAYLSDHSVEQHNDFEEHALHGAHGVTGCVFILSCCV